MAIYFEYICTKCTKQQIGTGPVFSGQKVTCEHCGYVEVPKLLWQD